MLTKEQITEQLKKVKDPELGYDIVNLGLIYEISSNNGAVDILMTLTSPACPAGDLLKNEMSKQLFKLPEVKSVNIQVTFSPPWNTEMLSEDLKKEFSILGLI